METIHLPAASREYLRVKITAEFDPTTSAVAFAFTPVTASPTSSDWVSGSWAGAASLTGGLYTAVARVLVGVAPSDKVLAAGRYRAWVRVSAAPEAVVREFAHVVVVS